MVKVIKQANNILRTRNDDIGWLLTGSLYATNKK